MKLHVYHISLLSIITMIFSGYLANLSETKINNINYINQEVNNYVLAWPGILPDKTYLYKLKVLRNKIIYKLLYQQEKKIEFDLLMADKTLYASKLLFDKGKFDLAKETALKGENYFSILVFDDYTYALNRKYLIPVSILQRISKAYETHQQLIHYLIDNATPEDKDTYIQVDYFSKSNYQALLELQKPKKNL